MQRTYGHWWNQCPSNLKHIGQHPETTCLSDNYLDLYFDTPVIPCSLQIYETYYPGTLTRVWACYQSKPITGSHQNSFLHRIQWISLWKSNSYGLNSTSHALRTLVPFNSKLLNTPNEFTSFPYLYQKSTSICCLTYNNNLIQNERRDLVYWNENQFYDNRYTSVLSHELPISMTNILGFDRLLDSGTDNFCICNGFGHSRIFQPHLV